MLDNEFHDDDDAHEEKMMRLEARVKAMIGVLEMEFQATPEEIVTAVVTLLADRDPKAMADSLTGHIEVLRSFFMPPRPQQQRSKFKRR